MNANRAWYVFAACNILLLALTAMVNDWLGGWGLSLFLAGPCVVWPALRLGPGWLIPCLMLSGLAGDAALPTPPGFLMCLFVAGALGVQALFPQAARWQRSQQISLAWVLNGLYFFAFTIWAMAENHAGGRVFFERVAADFCLSQIIVLLVASWHFDFQASVLGLVGSTAGPHRAGAGY